MEEEHEEEEEEEEAGVEDYFVLIVLLWCVMIHARARQIGVAQINNQYKSVPGVSSMPNLVLKRVVKH